MNDVDELLSRAEQLAASLRRYPASTYRLQLHAKFTFKDATAIVPYLAALGITHVYCSPYLQAQPHSTHGYDVIDHNQLNPELGSGEDFTRFCQVVTEFKMSQILDTVPNHAGVATNHNTWWNQVLEHGPHSRFGNYFDINWKGSARPDLQDRVLVPTLGAPYDEVLTKGQIQLHLDASKGEFFISYFDRRFPVAPGTYHLVVAAALSGLDSSDALQTFEEEKSDLIKLHLIDLLVSNSAFKDALIRNIESINKSAGSVDNFDAMDNLLSHQFYRLAYWRVASDEINYRRFFDINDLAALAMERKEVFDDAHALTLKLAAQGHVTGLRIDHPDGLYDPKQYFTRLQKGFIAACARLLLDDEQSWKAIQPELEQRIALKPSDLPLYAVAEKILAVGEDLPKDWACHGTTGYDFLNVVNGLFIAEIGEEDFTELYGVITDDHTTFEDLAYQKKRRVLMISFASELQMLTTIAESVVRKMLAGRDVSQNVLKTLLRELIACFPVYRTYLTTEEIPPASVEHISSAVKNAISRNPEISAQLFQFIADLLTTPDAMPEDEIERMRFVGKFQQLCSPVTAKGVEDTAFYVYQRFISLNEVGGDPSRFGFSPAEVHRYFSDRQDAWPSAMSALSTHDTKRSEDVRARLNVLSEIPTEWRDNVTLWFELNDEHHEYIDGVYVPAPDEEYLIYQTLIGAWPLDPASDEDVATFVMRVQAYLVKAIREAKVHSNWTDPNEGYENAVQQFISRIITPAFAKIFTPFRQQIARQGLINSLSQTVLRLAAPGVPDTYQGMELWDFSLVDPDNRRPVDYSLRTRMLDELSSQPMPQFTGELEDGRSKLRVTRQLLHLRRDEPALFASGSCEPIYAIGEKSDHVFAFTRRLGEKIFVAVVPRLSFAIAGNWGDTRLSLPGAKTRWRHLFSDFEIPADGEIRLADLFAQFPVAAMMTSVP